MDKPFGVSDPNSAHQTWARWAFDVRAVTAAWLAPDFEQVKLNMARFFRRLTQGTSAALNVEQVASATSPGTLRYVITLWWDRRDVLDTEFHERIRSEFERFMKGGLGESTQVTLKAPKLLAGDFEDGLPPAQWLHMAPRIHEGRIIRPDGQSES